MANTKIELESDDSLSDDSLEVSAATNVTNVASDTILDSPEKISCALCVTRTKGNKHLQPGRRESGQQGPLLVQRKLVDKHFETSTFLSTRNSPFDCLPHDKFPPLVYILSPNVH